MSTPDEDPFGWVGATVDGKYRVDEVVGHGGFGVVYRAHHLGFEETVALKCLKLPKQLQGGDRDRFRDNLVAEGRLLLQLSRATTGVVQALDVGAVVSPNKTWTPYLVLEWLDGTPLDRDLANRRRNGQGGRSLGEALELLDGAARALGVAHELGIAHRDIKPANLFLVQLAGRPTIKVLDFGIAKVLAESDSLTRAFEETGGTVQAFTARYAAPEQFSRRFGATGPWTDVFALALVFIEVVLGNPALDGSDAAQLFVASSDKQFRPTLRGRGFDPGDAVEGVLATALSVDPRERYPNAAAFWDSLTLAARHDPTRLDARPPVLDDSRPTREIGADAPVSFSGSAGFSPASSDGPIATSSRPTREAAEPTELSSSQGIRVVDAAPPTQPRRSGGVLRNLVWLGVLAAGLTGGALLWLNGESSSVPELKELPAAIFQRLNDAVSPSAGAGATTGEARPVPSAIGGSDEPSKPLAPLASSEASRPPAKTLGVAWPGTQFRQVPAGTLEGKSLWFESFRVVRRPEPAQGLDGALRACGEVGLSLCTESQWEHACVAFPEVAKDRAFTDSVETGGIVERGGEGCAARRVLPLSSGGEQLGLCCERAIGMSTKNLKNQFLSSTAGILRKLENALNQHDTNALVELLDEKVKLDGIERSKASVVALLSQTFTAAPDLVVTHESCDVAVQANKVVKRSKRGRKLTSYETNSWTAVCQQLRHQRGDAVPGNAEYLFSPASKLRGISAKNQATE